MGWEILRGDCVDRMAGMADCSVDSVVCDPPYGIGFMGKDWDGAGDGRSWGAMGGPTGKDNTTHTERGGATPAGKYDLRLKAMRAYQAWCAEWAAECLRVLKPGGHLLASCGTRTYHRMTAGIEDAGFEIRDTISWMYGSGFPKSLNVATAIEAPYEQPKELLPDEARFCGWIRDESGLTELDCRRLFGSVRFYSGVVEIVNTATVEAPRLGRRAMVPTQAAWAKARASIPAEPPEWVEALVKVPPQPQGDVPGDVWTPGKGNGTKGDNEWQGWGTALKPAHEPIVVARKPLAGTVAGNVLEHGTGALNVDGCRVGTSPDDLAEMQGRSGASTPNQVWGEGIGHDETWTPQSAGRWPANVVLSHTEGCVQVGVRKVKGSRIDKPYDGDARLGYQGGAPGRPARRIGDPDGAETVGDWSCSPDCPVRLLDEQTGNVRSAGDYPTTYSDSEGYGGGIGRVQGPLYSDSGGASRFFYCAKSSRAERNAGLEGFEKKALNWSSGEQSPGTFQAEGTDRSARNPHPTVKPIELMRWLVRLVTPPGGACLDPFAGSGTTGIAAVLEGFDFVGIEREDEYADIAEARIRWWEKHRGDGQAAAVLAAGNVRDAVEATGQSSLFDEAV